MKLSIFIRISDRENSNILIRSGIIEIMTKIIQDTSDEEISVLFYISFLILSFIFISSFLKEMAQCVICMLSMHAAQSKGGKDETLREESLKLVVMHLLSLATVCFIPLCLI